MDNAGRRIRILMTLLGMAVAMAVLNAMPAAGVVEPPLAASSNVHLLAHIPGTAAGMNFKDHYAYVSGWGGITVLDIANLPRRRSQGH